LSVIHLTLRKSGALSSQEQNKAPEDIKEVWFPGNHGDIGGGWDLEKDKTPRESPINDYIQLSDIALKWMIDEIDDVESSREDPTDRFAWDPEEKASFLQRFQKHKDEMISARMHDTMTWNGGSSSMLKVMMWSLMGTSRFRLARALFTPCAQNTCRGLLDAGNTLNPPGGQDPTSGTISAGRPIKADAVSSPPPRSFIIR